MRKHIAGAGVLVAAAMTAAAALAQERLQAGSLTCDVSAGLGLILGSQRQVYCTFTPAVPGPVDTSQVRLPACTRSCASAAAAVMAAATSTPAPAMCFLMRSPSAWLAARPRRRAAYRKFPQKRWMRWHASFSAEVAVA